MFVVGNEAFVDAEVMSSSAPAFLVLDLVCLLLSPRPPRMHCWFEPLGIQGQEQSHAQLGRGSVRPPRPGMLHIKMQEPEDNYTSQGLSDKWYNTCNTDSRIF